MHCETSFRRSWFLFFSLLFGISTYAQGDENYYEKYFPDKDVVLTFVFVNACEVIAARAGLPPGVCASVDNTLGEAKWNNAVISNNVMYAGAVSIVRVESPDTHIPFAIIRGCLVQYFFSPPFKTGGVTYPKAFSSINCSTSITYGASLDALDEVEATYNNLGPPAAFIAAGFSASTFNPTYPGTVAPVTSQKLLISNKGKALPDSGGVIEIAPSVYKGLCKGISDDDPKIEELNISCVDPLTSQATSGCQYTIQLSPGVNRGGHNHALSSSATRPIGLITPMESTVTPQPIPINGSIFTYEATDISQEVNFKVSGIGPTGNNLPEVSGIFRVKNPTILSPINIDGLEMNVASHSDGVYGTADFISKLTNAMDYYFENPPDIDTLISIESQGASLPWGGLFDINHDWLNPHCGHRDGETIDITTNTPNISLTPKEKQVLSRAITRSGLAFYVSEESPTNPSVSHWHVQTLKIIKAL